MTDTDIVERLRTAASNQRERASRGFDADGRTMSPEECRRCLLVAEGYDESREAILSLRTSLEQATARLNDVGQIGRDAMSERDQLRHDLEEAIRERDEARAIIPANEIPVGRHDAGQGCLGNSAATETPKEILAAGLADDTGGLGCGPRAGEPLDNPGQLIAEARSQAIEDCAKVAEKYAGKAIDGGADQFDKISAFAAGEIAHDIRALKGVV